MKMIKEGDRVRVVSLNIKGTVSYIDWRLIKYNHMYPFQIELDKAYDKENSGHKTYRTERSDLRRLRRRKR